METSQWLKLAARSGKRKFRSTSIKNLVAPLQKNRAVTAVNFAVAVEVRYRIESRMGASQSKRRVEFCQVFFITLAVAVQIRG